MAQQILALAMSVAFAPYGGEYAEDCALGAVRGALARGMLAAIRTVQQLLGYADVRTTMIYTRVLIRGGQGVRTPADMLGPRLGDPGARRNPSNALSDQLKWCNS